MRPLAGFSVIAAVFFIMVFGLLVSTPAAANAETAPSDVQTQIAQLLQLIKQLQAQMALLLGGSSETGPEGGTQGISVGATVETTDTLKVRSTPSATGQLLATMQPMSRGTVVGGPQTASGYTWWQIAYQTVTGWSASNWLRLVTAAPSTPLPPPPPPPPPLGPTAALTFTASATSITSGQTAFLNWSTSNVTSCTASGGWTGSIAISGNQSVSPTQKTTYTLTCSGSGGSVSKQVTIKVTPIDENSNDENSNDDNGDAPPGAIDIGENASQAARTLPNSTTIPTTAAYREDFTGNTGKDNFRYGVFHAGVGFQELGYPARIWGDGNAQNGHGGHWTADHDMSCGTPATQRPLSSSASDFNLDEIFYVCKDHIMSSVGDVDGYSIAWFSPKNSFSRATHKKVSWDVNLTDLFGRQWWEVSIVPKGGHVVATIEWNSRGDLIPYDNASVVIGNGPFGGGVNMITNGENRYADWRPICDGDFALDPIGCKDKMIRRPFSVTDNGNGTLTVNYAGLYTQTIPGKLPDEFDIYFTDHNYTPDKDGVPPGHTWHWDSIRVE